jgi:hypothetical protein
MKKDKRWCASVTTNVEIDGNIVEVDKGMVDVIKALSKRGFKTVASCSSLREDHSGIRRFRIERSDEAYVTVEGRHPELIEIAEASGWAWRFDSKSYTDDDKTPLDHVNFYSSCGKVYKSVQTAREKRSHLFWREKHAPSSKEEAIQTPLPIIFTTLMLTTQDPTTLVVETREPASDEFIKQRIDALQKAIDLNRALSPKAEVHSKALTR